MTDLASQQPLAARHPPLDRFLNFAHARDHYVMLIYPTVVLGLEAVYGRPMAN